MTDAQEREAAKLELERQRGSHVERLMSEPFLVEAFETLEQHLIQTWRGAKDPAVRETAWAEIHALDQVRNHLRTIIQTGQIAAKSLSMLQRVRGRIGM